MSKISQKVEENVPDSHKVSAVYDRNDVIQIGNRERLISVTGGVSLRVVDDDFLIRIFKRQPRQNQTSGKLKKYSKFIDS